MITCNAYILRMSSNCHCLMPSINILQFEDESSFDGEMDLISNSLLVLEIRIIDGSKGFLVPLIHGEGNKIKRLNNAVRSWR